jgi:hypothetical protein
MYQPNRLPGSDHPATIIHGALPYVPGIDVPAEHHHLVGMLPPNHFRNDVARLHLG